MLPYTISPAPTAMNTSHGWGDAFGQRRVGGCDDEADADEYAHDATHETPAEVLARLLLLGLRVEVLDVGMFAHERAVAHTTGYEHGEPDPHARKQEQRP